MRKGFRFPEKRFSAARANEASKIPGHLARLADRIRDEVLPDFGDKIADVLLKPRSLGKSEISRAAIENFARAELAKPKKSRSRR